MSIEFATTKIMSSDVLFCQTNNPKSLITVVVLNTILSFSTNRYSKITIASDKT